jgi:hypothetical protein
MIAISSEKLAAEANRYRHLAGGVLKSANEYIVIEIFKPLFECLLKRNKKGTIGRNFIQVFPSIYAELFMIKNELKGNEDFAVYDKYGSDYEIQAKAARLIYFYLAKHDNKRTDYIDINILDLALSCFPSFIRYQDNKPIVRCEKGFDIRAKIKKAIILFKILASKNKVNEGQFIPIELDENTVQYRKEEKIIRIKVQRPINKNNCRFTITEDIKNFAKRL